MFAAEVFSGSNGAADPDAALLLMILIRRLQGAIALEGVLIAANCCDFELICNPNLEGARAVMMIDFAEITIKRL